MKIITAKNCFELSTKCKQAMNILKDSGNISSEISDVCDTLLVNHKNYEMLGKSIEYVQKHYE